MKLASILLLVLTLALAIILSRLFKLKKRGINAADLAFPFLIFEYYLITAKMFTHNQLPVLGTALSILAIVLVFFFLNKKRSFYYPKFIKFFWRAGFLLTLLIYIIMIVQIFMMKQSTITIQLTSTSIIGYQIFLRGAFLMRFLKKE